MNKKPGYGRVIGILAGIIFVLVGINIGILSTKEVKHLDFGKGEKNGQQETWNTDSLRKGLLTVIDYDKQYEAFISSKEEAKQAITDYGILQRSKYPDSEVEEIELQMEKDFDIFAVNLGEIDIDTARDIQTAFIYMYQTYPMLQGTLTNVSLGNFEGDDSGKIAITQSSEFIIHEDYGVCPYVVRHEIIFNAAKFLKRDKLIRTCEEMVESGYWPPNTDITAIVVHELGHQVLNVYAQERFGLKDGYYITEENQEAYSRYLTDMLSINQKIPKEVLGRAYKSWLKNHPEADYETFCGSISAYAAGKQKDGGIAYPETFAEALADIYLNGENAADASKAIEETVRGFNK